MTIAIKNDNKTPLVVPRAVRRRAGFKSGQELEIKASGGCHYDPSYFIQGDL